MSVAPTPGPVSFPGAGLADPKPEVIVQLERGDELWVLDMHGAEQPSVDGSGAWGAAIPTHLLNKHVWGPTECCTKLTHGFGGRWSVQWLWEWPLPKPGCSFF